MGLFSKKINNEEKTWKVYQDMLGDKKMSIRVNMKYADKNYKNTFYVQVKYGEDETNEFPTKKNYKI